MIMTLPEHFNHPTVEIRENTLFIKKLIRFEDLMYELSYALKKRHCCYCGKKLSVRDSTMDHRWPKYSGGISITDNLYPCCSDCNSRKGKLTHEEFLKFESIKNLRAKKQYLECLELQNEQAFKDIGFKLPDEWISYVETKLIKHCRYDIFANVSFRGKRYERISLFYEKYNQFPCPVMLDKNNQLLDGYNVFLYAQDHAIDMLPAIQLENVIIVNT